LIDAGAAQPSPLAGISFRARQLCCRLRWLLGCLLRSLLWQADEALLVVLALSYSEDKLTASLIITAATLAIVTAFRAILLPEVLIATARCAHHVAMTPRTQNVCCLTGCLLALAPSLPSLIPSLRHRHRMQHGRPGS
jgi:hypothetical protein